MREIDCDAFSLLTLHVGYVTKQLTMMIKSIK